MLVGVASDSQYPPEGIVRHDPDWSAQYTKLANALHRTLGDHWQIEHIGQRRSPVCSPNPSSI